MFWGWVSVKTMRIVVAILAIIAVTSYAQIAFATNGLTTWYLAEGCTTIGNGIDTYSFDTFVLIQNPNSTVAEVAITYMDNYGNTETQVETVAANSRFTQKINDYEVDGIKVMDEKFGVSTKIESTNGVGIIAERAMYWYDPTDTYWIGGHNSKGYSQE